MNTTKRYARVIGQAKRVDEIQRYLPSNYTCYEFGPDVLITGFDVAGWTLDGYVIPRLASGLIAAKEYWPPTSRVHFAITIDVPDAEPGRRALIDRINAESGLGDSGSQYDDFLMEDNDDAFDNSEFGAFILENWTVSATAADLVTNYEVDTEAI